MNKTLVAALTLAIAAATAQADTQTVEVTATALRDVPRQLADEAKGLYFMSDGRRMRMWRSGPQVVASLDGEARAELRAVDARTLRSADGRMTVRITSQPSDPSTDIVVSLIPQGQGAPLALATRR
jgi:hypothetical protein